MPALWTDSGNRLRWKLYKLKRDKHDKKCHMILPMIDNPLISISSADALWTDRGNRWKSREFKRERSLPWKAIRSCQCHPSINCFSSRARLGTDLVRHFEHILTTWRTHWTIGLLMVLVRVVIGEHRQKKQKPKHDSTKEKDFGHSLLQTTCIWQQNNAIKHANPGWSFFPSWLPGLMWLTISSGFKDKHCQLGSIRLSNLCRPSRGCPSEAWSDPLLAGPSSVISKALWAWLMCVVCMREFWMGWLDNHHDFTYVLLSYTGIWLFVELELFKWNDPTLKHMTSGKTWYPSFKVAIIHCFEMRHSRWLRSLKLINPSGPKRKFHLPTIYLQGQAVSFREGKIFKKNEC